MNATLLESPHIVPADPAAEMPHPQPADSLANAHTAAELARHEREIAEQEYIAVRAAGQRLTERRESEVYERALEQAHTHYSGMFSPTAMQSPELHAQMRAAAERAVNQHRAEVADIASTLGRSSTALVVRRARIERAVPHIIDDEVSSGDIVEDDDTVAAATGTAQPESALPLSRLEHIAVKDAEAALRRIAELDPRDVLSGALLGAACRDLGPALTVLIPELFGGARNVTEQQAGYGGHTFADILTEWKDEAEAAVELQASYTRGLDSMAEDAWKRARDLMAGGASPTSIRLVRSLSEGQDTHRVSVRLGFPHEDTDEQPWGSIEVDYRTSYYSQGDQQQKQTMMGKTTILGDEKPDERHPDEYSLAALGVKELAGAILAREKTLQQQQGETQRRQTAVRRFVGSMAAKLRKR